jgi:hypothetical protein
MPIFFFCSFYANHLIQIKAKQEESVTWNELIIKNGPFKLLALDGLVGSFVSDKVTPFLGSSIPITSDLLKSEQVECYASYPECQYIQTYRYLRDYKKRSPKLKASFWSERFTLVTSPTLLVLKKKYKYKTNNFIQLLLYLKLYCLVSNNAVQVKPP